MLHPEFVDGQYAFYTRPQDSFIEAGSGGGIGWGLAKNMEHAVIEEETILDRREYHTINEVKNGLGPAPIKTEKGWLHLAHGVRNTAAGLRYVLYCFLCDLAVPYKVIAKPGGYFLAPEGEERIGDVSNVTFSNGWVRRGDEVFIYYGASDTRTNVATTTVERLLDYVLNTPPDPLRSAACVRQRIALIEKNLRLHREGKRDAGGAVQEGADGEHPAVLDAPHGGPRTRRLLRSGLLRSEGGQGSASRRGDQRADPVDIFGGVPAAGQSRIPRDGRPRVRLHPG